MRPLDGVRVLDFTRVLSGPHATRMLCDLGADVIKVEQPSGDLTRFSSPRVNSNATYFIQQNVGKRNISLDLSNPEAVALVIKLVEKCDVIIENFRPGVMKRMGLDQTTLRAVNPKIIYASITGYGNTGPWTDRRAYAPVVNAEMGLTKHQGDARGGEYANDPFSHGDVYTAVECAAAILAALYQREQTGVGQYIDLSMAQTLLYVNEHVHDALWDQPVSPDAIRSFRPQDYPVLTTKDGVTAVVSGHPAERGTFDYFVAAMQAPELLEDSRFKTVETRLANFKQLMEIIKLWASTVPTVDELENRLAKHKLAMGRLRSVSEVAQTDWAKERNAFVEISDRGTGKVKLPNSPWIFSGSDTSTRGVAKYRGEDNAEVFSELLGLSETQIEDLYQRDILSQRGPSK
ncbi:MAG: CoA transferase [Ilumatobacteraceae bacterium]|nr:CoA transferase [Ilumatobacteraceae bacterium]